MVNLNGKSVVVRIPTEPQSEPTEISPLNQRGRDNNSDASSSASAVTSDQSTKKLIEYNMEQSKQILLRIIIDFLLLCCVSVPIVILFFMAEPTKRGFFCDDESLMLPYHKSTVKHWMLYVFGLIMPILIIFIIEAVRTKMKLDDNHQLKLFSWNIPICVQQLYKYMGFFSFGAGCCQLTTEIAKYTVGRFRPHFMTVCQPIMSDGTDCSNPINFHRYIENFSCSNPESTDKVLRDMRMSFPSANSSFSFYTMVFCALYLHSRLSWKGSKLIKYFLQFFVLLLAWFTSLSRISDYKHHWSDVLAGAALGIFFAIIVDYCIKNSTKQNQNEILPSNQTELNLKDTNGNNN